MLKKIKKRKKNYVQAYFQILDIFYKYNFS